MGYNNGKGVIMTKQDFMEQLIEELYRYFSPEQYQLEGSVLLKNNDTKRYAILLKKTKGRYHLQFIWTIFTLNLNTEEQQSPKQQVIFMSRCTILRIR